MAAPVRDSELYAQAVTATSLTFAFNNVAGDSIYVMGQDKDSSATVVTGVTYAAAALTKINEQDGGAGKNDRAITAWRRLSPATGSNNVVITASESQNLRFSAISYSNVSQATPENGTDVSQGSGVTTLSTDITTTADECVMIHFSKDGSGGVTYTNTTGDTILLNADAGGHCIVESGSISPAGLNTVTNTMSSVTLGAIAWAIRSADADVPAENLVSGVTASAAIKVRHLVSAY